MVYSLVQKNSTDTFIVQNNLILETTRLFLSKNSDFTKLVKSETSLYYDGNLLLENISLYDVSKANDIMTIDICIYDNKICQVWKIKD